MATGKKPESGPSSEFGQPYVPGDRIPTPEAVERNTDSAWAAWSEATADQEARFADTTPESVPMKLGGADPRYADTRPTGLGPRQSDARTMPPATPASLEDVMVEARKNNRVCPRPDHWQRLFTMLPDKLADRPAAPLIGAAWAPAPSLSKRMCMREHIEWAAAHGALDQVFAFLKQIPESEWHHMSD